jgi:hypothetical protein
VPRACSIFSQLLRLPPRLEFEGLIRRHRAERHARGFIGWGRLVAKPNAPSLSAARNA